MGQEVGCLARPQSIMNQIWYWFNNMYIQLLREIRDMQSMSSEQLKAFDCLLDFIYHEKHMECLQVMMERNQKEGETSRKSEEKTTGLSEATLQGILAAHLFSPLIVGGNYMIDVNQGQRSCAACNKPLRVGDTSFGHEDVWHGPADIFIGGSIVKVEKDTKTTIDSVGGQPLTKRIKLNSIDRVDSDDSDYNSDSIIDSTLKKTIHSQILSQTIVNAFCESKRNKFHSKLFIPSFFVSESHVSIHMYSCSEDKLLTSKELPLWSKKTKGKLNINTLVCIWMALNFETFDSSCDLIPIIPKSNFKNVMVNVSKYHLYSNEVSRPVGRTGIHTNQNEHVMKIFPQYSKQVETEMRELAEGYKRERNMNIHNKLHGMDL